MIVCVGRGHKSGAGHRKLSRSLNSLPARLEGLRRSPSARFAERAPFPPPHTDMRWHRNLTAQVLVAISIGVLLGLLAPGTAKAMKPVGDTFVNLVKMVITPVIFLTIVVGIGNMSDLKKVGRVGGKALLYFEIVSTIALAIGMVVVNVTKPGAGLDISMLAKGDISKYAQAGEALTFSDFVTHIVPASAVGAFANGDVL